MSKPASTPAPKRKPIMYIVHDTPSQSDSGSLFEMVSSAVRIYTDTEWKAWLDAAYERHRQEIEAHSYTCGNDDNRGDK